MLHFRGTNLSQFVALRWIAAHTRDESVAIRRATTDCCTLAGPICRNSLRCDRLLHFRRTNLSQFVALRQIAALSRDQSVAIRRATTDCCTFKDQSVAIRRATTDCFQGTNLSQLVVLRQIAAHSRDQSVAIRCATTDCCTFPGLIYRNSSRYDRLLHFRGTNLSQFVALRQIAAHSQDQSVATRRLTTDCCTCKGPICPNSSRYNRLLHIRGTNLSQLVALRQIAAHSRDQSVTIRRATTDCCTCKGPICRNSSRYDRLLHFRGTNLSQFVALRLIAALSRDQFVAIRCATSICCTFAGPICRNSSRYDRLLHFQGTNLSQFVGLRQIAALSRNQSVANKRATTDCCTFTGPICRNSSRYDRLLHFRGTNLPQINAL